jgi:uncharacterized DUF497 family protein
MRKLYDANTLEGRLHGGCHALPYRTRGRLAAKSGPLVESVYYRVISARAMSRKERMRYEQEV